MKSITKIFLFAIVLCNTVKAQDYTIIPVTLNAQSFPGDFFLSKARVQNNSANTITIFMERIIKNIPPNWTSCFCYPFCIAPFVDTLSFQIAPYSVDSIMPNYGSDSVPGIGTIVSTIYQIGYESVVDTITFTGSTLSSGVNSAPFVSTVSIFPNPVSTQLNININNSAKNYFVTITDATGQIIYSENISGINTNIDVRSFCKGFYMLAIFDGKNKINRKFIIE